MEKIGNASEEIRSVAAKQKPYLRYAMKYGITFSHHNISPHIKKKGKSSNLQTEN